ncbi:MAG: nucleotide exchange factor GrpE [Pseudoflavonifractor sp.]|nr:nucleotide exchange factor GrpE [Pseudoflavonifractor sp.]
MSKKEKEKQVPETELPKETPAVETAQPEAAGPEAEETNPLLEELETLKSNLSEQEEKFLRLAAEYDNFRRRSQKEKEAVYADAKADAVKTLLPVYDNLDRALKQETADEAYAKGVEMTMTGLKKALESLGVTEIDAAGQPFDPTIHNAVMHVEDDTLGENTVAEVFQAGFRLEDRVIRFAMVKVAN